jgi:hypothetical protein
MTRTEYPFMKIIGTMVPPKKGDIISFDALGNGVQKRFRVLETYGGNTVKLFGLDNLEKSYYYNNTPITAKFEDDNYYVDYNGSDLDTYLNTTYYNSLSNAVKSAIISETFIQSCYSRINYYSSDADFKLEKTLSSQYGGSYGYKRITQKISGNKYVHALDLDEIKSYFNLSAGASITDVDMLNAFFDRTTPTTKNC